jgi:tight adherence protein B
MARSSLRREVRTLTAEGRISAYVLVGLPPALGVMVFSVNHTYISVLFNTRPGNMALLVGLVMEAVGGLWLRKTVTIEI